MLTAFWIEPQGSIGEQLEPVPPTLTNKLAALTLDIDSMNNETAIDTNFIKTPP